jgi:hypothetical protein
LAALTALRTRVAGMRDLLAEQRAEAERVTEQLRGLNYGE